MYTSTKNFCMKEFTTLVQIEAHVLIDCKLLQ